LRAGHEPARLVRAIIGLVHQATDWRTGTIIEWQPLTASLATFRVEASAGELFSPYQAGQYIALRRDRCHLTTARASAEGTVEYVPALDRAGRQKLGSVAHSYSIASAPFETAAHRYLEFYVTRETDSHGTPGRLSRSLFDRDTADDRTIAYFGRIAGTFTLANRARGCRSVLMVGTGTGLAPFVSMIKQIDHEARTGRASAVRYTLLHANRTRQELAYHEALLAIEAARRFDFLYLPSVSRPVQQDMDARLGQGRANNLLRHIFGMPLQEPTATIPVLPAHVRRDGLLTRFAPTDTVLLTCGNPASVADITHIAGTQRIRVETENW
jgi:ferredoxin-NADP reductase